MFRPTPLGEELCTGISARLNVSMLTSVDISTTPYVDIVMLK